MYMYMGICIWASCVVSINTCTHLLCKWFNVNTSSEYAGKAPPALVLCHGMEYSCYALYLGSLCTLLLALQTLWCAPFQSESIVPAPLCLSKLTSRATSR